MAVVAVRNQSQGRTHAPCINESSSIQYQASDDDHQPLACQYCEQIETSKDALDQHSAACAKKTDECPRCRKFVARGIFVTHYANNCEDSKGSNASTPQPPPTPRKRSSLQRSASSASQQTRPVARDLHSRDSIIRIPCQFCNEAVELPMWSTHVQDCREKENRRGTHSAQSSRRNSMSIDAPPRRSTPANNEHPTKPTAAPRSGSVGRSNSALSLNSSYQTNSGRRTPSVRTNHSSSFSSNENTQKIEQSKPRGNSLVPARRSPSPRPPMSDDSKSKATKFSKNASPNELTSKQTSSQHLSRIQSLPRSNSPSKPSRPRASSEYNSFLRYLITHIAGNSSVSRQSVSSGKDNGRGGSNPSQSKASKSLATPDAFSSSNTNPQVDYCV
ncbi:unnamed protein product [Adineta ricciae]|uniref:Uncharacterized protein n=1 Tax=Adineta ricciae TaxID=249248 RepID=A0A815EPP3_ADIRI|nr:unnamed protein product [Adineta ricciae]CAF1324844.1 unnamed protein product [Adineta ricciae]